MSLNIWYVSLYEPLPLLADRVRPMRTGLLCQAMRDFAGEHLNITLWLPRFDHISHSNYSMETLEQPCDGVRIVYLDSIGYPNDTSIWRFLHNYILALNLKKLAYSHATVPDIIICQIPSLELADACVQLAKKFRCKLSVDIRDPWPDNYIRLLPSFLKFIYPYLFFFEIRRLRRILNAAHCVTAVSKTYLNWARSQKHAILPAQSAVFEIGYPEESILQDRTECANSYSTCLKLVFAGTFNDGVDWDSIVHAMASFESDGVHVELFIAGSGVIPSDYLSKLSKLSNVHLLGWLSREELKRLMISSVVGLIPLNVNALQSLPNKPFEYMAHGLAILSSLPGELSDLISVNQLGLHYDFYDVDALRRAILVIYSDRVQLDIFRNNALSLVRMRYANNHIYPDMVKFIVDSCNKSGVI